MTTKEAIETLKVNITPNLIKVLQQDKGTYSLQEWENKCNFVCGEKIRQYLIKKGLHEMAVSIRKIVIASVLGHYKIEGILKQDGERDEEGEKIKLYVIK